MGHSLLELEPIIELPPPPELSPKKPPRFPWLVLGLGVASIFAVLTIFEIADWEGDEPRMSEKRKRQLEKALQEFEEAEQYVLLARVSGYYPCPRCSNQVIYLNAGEIWKYGVTRKGEEGRYNANFLKLNNLKYVIEFRGELGECLRIEKMKLFNYPFLPENKRRKKVDMLVLPPGNLRTD